MVCLELFGGISLESEQGPLTGPAAQRRRLALLALLAAAYPGALARAKLIAYLWPERDAEHARNLLSQAVYVLRKALDEEAILAAGDELRFNPGVVACDVVGFAQALAAGELARAVELYAGPFLDGFYLSETPEFERWVEGERARYRRAYGTALQGLAERAAAEQDFAAAAEWWRRLAAQDPYDAPVTFRLMEALEAAGDRVGALQQARVHAALLEQEFGIGPDPRVTALAERLRSPPAVTASPTGEPRAAQPAGSAGTGQGPRVPPAGDVPTVSTPPLPAVGGQLVHPLAALQPPTLSTPPFPAVRSGRRASRWQSAALLTATGLGLAAMLLVGRLLPETGAPAGAATGTAAASPRAVAVLPCANLSRDPEEEYFSDGLTEELIGVLSQVRSLRVVARTSAFAFKGEHRDVREIGRRLNVGTVLECSARREGERVRVTAQLIDAADGFHLWAQTYEREGTDIFAIQSDLALHIVSALQAELTPGERARLARRPTENPEAHTLYLKGRYFWNQRSRGGLARAIEYYERAIQADPQYAAAYAGLASTYGPLDVLGYIPPWEGRERMRETVFKAVELDDGLAEAHAALAAYLFLYQWDAAAAEREYLRAIELDPDYATAHMWHGFFLDAMGRSEEALEAARRAVQLDPLAPITNSHLGGSLTFAGRPDLAIEHARNAIELDSTFWLAYRALGRAYETMGELEAALRAYEKAVAFAGPTPEPTARLARVLALTGREREAQRILAVLQAEAAETGVYVPLVATVFLALGDEDAALSWAEAAARQRHPAFPHDMKEPGFASLRDDPRFQELLRRVGLPG